MTTHLSPAQARHYLVGQLGLRAVEHPAGAAGVRSLLHRLRCIQLDPLDRIGTNADLVALARIDDLHLGEVYDALLPGTAFEHFAKERCLLPHTAFPYYRDQAAQTPWWRLTERLRRLADKLGDPETGILSSVREEVAARGPIGAWELTDRGRIEAMDWSGWKGTGSATKMAVEVLWTRCQVVVVGRSSRGKIYDVPERALSTAAAAPADTFGRWAVQERVEAAGLLATASGPHWSMLHEVRTSDLSEQLVAEGVLEEVLITGSRRTYLAPAGFLDRTFPDDDGRMRILGPLDPVVWDRKLVSHLFDFDYVWEVYKPAKQRIWGYYVCPLLHQGRLVGRIEGHREGDELVIDQLWRQPGEGFDEAAWEACWTRHAEAMRPRQVRPDQEEDAARS